MISNAESLLRPQFHDMVKTISSTLRSCKLQLSSSSFYYWRQYNIRRIKCKVNPLDYLTRRKHMSRRRFAIRKHFYYKPNELKKALKKRLSRVNVQRQKRKKKKAFKKAARRRLRLTRLRKKKSIKKKKLPHSKQIARNFKFSRYHKGRNPVFYQISTHYKLQFGRAGFKILQSSKLNAKQLYFAKELLIRMVRGRKKKKRKLRRRLWFWDYTLSDVPVTKKPNEIRMGKGKGQVKLWITRSMFGKIMFELNHVRRQKLFRIFTKFGSLVSRPYTIIRLRPQKWKKKFRS